MAGMNFLRRIAKAIYRRCAAVSLIVGTLALATVVHAGIPIEHWTQASGAQVYLVQSPSIPMVDVQVDFDSGGRRDPAEQVGLASMTAAATGYGVRAHGAEPALDENGLSEAWADLGATFNTTASADRMSFSMRSLSYADILERAVTLASRQLGEPAFTESAWQRDRPKVIASIKESNTRPATVAGRAFSKAVFGNHPYGREPTEATLNRITVADMKVLHDKLLRPCAAKVSVVGAVDRAQADAMVKRLLERLPVRECAPLPPVAEVLPLVAPSEQRIAFQSAQAQVLVGQPGIARKSPDYFAVTVGNHILGGGGFTSRLTEEVREKRGLTYSVYSYFSPGLHAGAFTIGLQTRPDQADAALKLVREVVGNFIQHGPTEAELQAAKDNLVGGFVLRIDSNRKLLDNVSNIAWNDLPLNYLDTWVDHIQQLTVADIRAAMSRNLQPNTMATVVLGATP